MIVGTTEAANILNISTARLRKLMIEGRVEGAYKTGKMWLIPLFNGKPIIKKGKRGPNPSWRNPRKPAKTIVHVNSHKIKHNQKHSSKQAVITVKRGNTNHYVNQVEILGGCRVVYCPERPKCGATVWIETLFDIKIVS